MDELTLAGIAWAVAMCISLVIVLGTHPRRRP